MGAPDQVESKYWKSGHRLGLMSSLELDWHAQPRVTALAVEECDRHPAPERLDHRVVEATPDRAHRGHEPRVECSPRERRRRETDALIGMDDVPSGRRPSIAMPSALVTRPAVGVASIDQPTTRREKTSSTTTQGTLPSRVGCSVISVTHSRSGSSRQNRRSTRSLAVATLGIRRKCGRPDAPAIPARRMSRSIAHRPTRRPCPG